MNAATCSHRWRFGDNGTPDKLETIITVPLKVISEANARGHWSKRAKRTREQRTTMHLVCSAPLVALRDALELPHCVLVIRLDRIAPKALDDDNAVGSLKACRDGVTDALGLKDDSDTRLRWEYGQDKGKPKEYAVRVTAYRRT